ncbi:MAG: hypothetical protein U0V02_13630 [Anaerolineales bacterium]
MDKRQNGGVNINNSSVRIQGDIVGRDKVTSLDTVHEDFSKSIFIWEKQLSDEVAKLNLSPDEKADLFKQLEQIKSALIQDKGKNPARLEKLVNMLAVMSPDIFDVAITTLASPLAGIGLTLRKISDKAKLENLSK